MIFIDWYIYRFLSIDYSECNRAFAGQLYLPEEDE